MEDERLVTRWDKPKVFDTIFRMQKLNSQELIVPGNNSFNLEPNASIEELLSSYAHSIKGKAKTILDKQQHTYALIDARPNEQGALAVTIYTPQQPLELPEKLTPLVEFQPNYFTE